MPFWKSVAHSRSANVTGYSEVNFASKGVEIVFPVEDYSRKMGLRSKVLFAMGFRPKY